MFVIDALIGNPDRNNGNWGFIIDKNKKIKLAPIYDNGNCLNNKWDDSKMNRVLFNSQELKNEAYMGRRCIFKLNNKFINPYKLLQNKQYDDANLAIIRIVPLIDMYKINKIICDIPDTIISPLRKEFYFQIMDSRYKEVLLPLYHELEKEKIMSFEEKLEVLSKNESNSFHSYKDTNIDIERI